MVQFQRACALMHTFASLRVICSADGAVPTIASAVLSLVFALRDMSKFPSVSDGEAHHQAQLHCATPMQIGVSG